MTAMIEASTIFTGMRGRRITVVGDVMLDRFVSGSVSRISPEAPVPVLRRGQEINMPGGAANVARNLAHLGVETILIGVTGKDDHASMLDAALQHEPAIRFQAIVDNRRATIVKTRFSASGQQILRVDDEDTSPLSPQLEKKIIAATRKALRKSDLLVISDYNKGVISATTAREMIALARDAGVPVLADPKKMDASIYAGVTIITPNLGEAQQLFGTSATDIDTITPLAEDACKKHGIDSILVTLGSEGMLLAGRDLFPCHIRSHAQSVYDVSGAGDTVIATMAATMAAAGADPMMATRLANTAAGVVVGKAGTSTVTPGEILAEIVQGTDTDLDGLLGRISAWRTEGLTIGFTNGCFDQLHPGHLWIMEQAAATCDRLIVGLNSDASTRALKGPTRPFQHEERRAAVLASLPMVDAVVVFDEKTPARLIRAVKPDRLIKGGDYKAEDVVGRKTVLARGGKVVIIPTVEGYSTTRLSQPRG